MPFEKNVDIKEMAKKTENWTGADIEAVVRFAGINSIKRNYTLKESGKLTVTKEDFNVSMKEVGKDKKDFNIHEMDMNKIMKNLPKVENESSKGKKK